MRYVGESGRNLKVRVHEHKLRSSKSALSLHVRGFEGTEEGSEGIDYSGGAGEEWKKTAVYGVCLYTRQTTEVVQYRDLGPCL